MKGWDVLFLGKAIDSRADQAEEFLRAHFSRLTVSRGRRQDPFSILDQGQRWHLVISYLSPWIVPAWILERTTVAAINFHPGPPSYPGIGCTNFAIYHEEDTYGVTCHHMAQRVDRGGIIAVRRFPLYDTDSVYDLTMRCYEEIAVLFQEVITGLLAEKPLPVSKEAWTRAPYRRVELDALCEIQPDMSIEEIRRRVRATAFPGMPGAYVVLGGERFLSEKSIAARRNKENITSSECQA